ncbi:MAG: four helix bundle protein [Deltaproteobacteria bacterium]|nr:four helix bundle protein [Deltaproteobacteria bacterium]
MADQLLRSATSGGSNDEEARSTQSRRDFVHKVSLAAKEMRESVYWLGLVERANLAPQSEIPPLLREASELVAILMSTHSDSRFTFTSPAPIAVPRPLFPAPSSQFLSSLLSSPLLSVVAHRPEVSGVA